MAFRMCCDSTSLCLCLIFILTVREVSTQTGELVYQMTEGSTSRVVGNPVTDNNLRSTLGNLVQYQFSFVSPNNSQSRYFTIDHSSGEIRTIEPLDREVLCSAESCPVNLDVAVQSVSAELELVKILRVRVNVLDVNDNAPSFPEDIVQVLISESDPIETTVGLYAATDEDIAGNNSKITYQLVPQNGVDKFDMKIVSNFDGSTDVGVVLKQKLDREIQAAYKLLLLAKDGGKPSLTGTLTIDISVTDSNDHIPVFTKPVYNVTIWENVTMGTEILRLDTNDQDIGLNGQVSYRFNPRSAAKIGSVFKIEQKTGAVIVDGAVDFETSPVYQLIVEASDSGIPPKSSQSTVVIHVQDVNDNPPEITFNLLAGGDHAIVSEFAKPGSFIGHVSVNDPDKDVTQQISCTMESVEFSLQRMSRREYKIILLTKLNREATGEYNLTIACSDNGTPSLQASNALLVMVKDENDNSPVFEQTNYSKTIPENFPIGKSILKVSAYDTDFGENSNITYEIVDSNGLLFAEPNSGVISPSGVLDREQREVITFEVRATDNGDSKLSSTATVVLTLEDINDVPPTFTKGEYVIWVNENIEILEDLLVLSVVDPDSGSGGSYHFSMMESSAPGVFQMSRTEGSIRTSQVFDREETEEYRMVIMATDEGTPPLSSSTTVIIKIQDMNDNDPVITFPSISNNTVDITSWQSDTYVTQVKASDRDAGGNGRLTYSMEEPETAGFLFMDGSTGTVRLSQTIDESSAGKYELSILVQDNGYPVRSAHQKLVIQVSANNGTALASIPGTTSPNMAIVIAVVSITVIVSLAILLLICVIRKHDRTKKSQPPKMEEEKIMRRRGSSSTASKTSQQSDLSTVTCLDEMRKDISFTISDDSQGFSSSHKPLTSCYIFTQGSSHPVTENHHPEISHPTYIRQKYDTLEKGVSGLIEIDSRLVQISTENNNLIKGGKGTKDSDDSSEGLTSSDSGRGASDEDLADKKRSSQFTGGNCYVKFVRADQKSSKNGTKLSSFRQSPSKKDKDDNHYYDMTVLRQSQNKRGKPAKSTGPGSIPVPLCRPVSLHIEPDVRDNDPYNNMCEEGRVNSETSLSPYYMKSFGNKPNLSTFGKQWSTTDSRSYSIEMEDLNTSSNI